MAKHTSPKDPASMTLGDLQAASEDAPRRSQLPTGETGWIWRVVVGALGFVGLLVGVAVAAQALGLTQMQRVAALESNWEQLSGQLEAVSGQLAAQEKQTEALGKTIEERETALESLGTEVSSLKTKLNQQAGLTQRLEGQLGECRAAISANGVAKAPALPPQTSLMEKPIPQVAQTDGPVTTIRPRPISPPPVENSEEARMAALEALMSDKPGRPAPSSASAASAPAPTPTAAAPAASAPSTSSRQPPPSATIRSSGGTEQPIQ